ncbi:MAG: hemin ABC transporter substrate-binding protein [Chthoniobacterales bacterium]
MIRSKLFVSAILSVVLAGSVNAARIVSVGGPITEVVYALGAQDQLVAADTSSIYPEAATKLPQVGYQRNISAEGVLSVKPDLVLLAATAGPPPAIEQIKATGVRMEVIPEQYTLEGVVEKIHRIGDAIGKKTEADELAKKLEAQFAAVKKEGVKNQPKIIFLMSRGPGTPVAAGKNTAANSMIELAGGVNVVSEFEGYKTVTPEAIVTMNPDIIVTTTRTRDAIGESNLIKSVPGLELTTAGRTSRVVCMEDLKLLGFGPRTGEALQELKKDFASTAISVK